MTPRLLLPLLLLALAGCTTLPKAEMRAAAGFAEAGRAAATSSLSVYSSAACHKAARRTSASSAGLAATRSSSTAGRRAACSRSP